MGKYIVYETTCLINSKTYIGCHKFKVDDKYLGSNQQLKDDVEFYGYEHFKLKVLAEFDNEPEALAYETSLVTEEYVSNPLTYNCHVGGGGSWTRINAAGKNIYKRTKKHKAISSKIIKKVRKQIEADPVWAEQIKAKRVATVKRRYAEGDLVNPFKGKKHSEESKKLIGATTSKAQKGSGNSQYGKVWIYNSEHKKSIKIMPEQLDTYVANGWLKGRKLKFN